MDCAIIASWLAGLGMHGCSESGQAAITASSDRPPVYASLASHHIDTTATLRPFNTTRSTSIHLSSTSVISTPTPRTTDNHLPAHLHPREPIPTSVR